ncbi:MAG: hypothetical protein KDA83_09215 [Planctomycetales bacterium]|nr:hypothetical protein [Planctomycetales bacterium]
MEATLTTDKMASLIASRHRTLSELRIVAARQYKVIEAHEHSKLMELLAIKQGLINRLIDCDRDLDPYRQQDPEDRQWVSDQKRDQCRVMIEESSQWLDDIKRLEAAAELLARELRDEVSQQVDEVANRSQAVNAYLGVRKTPPPRELFREG